MKAQIGQWGNSLGIRIPKYLVDTLNLQPNDKIEFSTVSGNIIIKPIKPLEDMTLEDLLEQLEPPFDDEIDWGKPEGKEIW